MPFARSPLRDARLCSLSVLPTGLAHPGLPSEAVLQPVLPFCGAADAPDSEPFAYSAAATLPLPLKLPGSGHSARLAACAMFGPKEMPASQ